MWLTVKRWPSQEGHVQNRKRKCEGSREKRRNVSFFFFTVNVLPVLLKFSLLLNANFSINPFHANF